MYKKIKHFMTEKNVSSGSCIKNESGDILFEKSFLMTKEMKLIYTISYRDQ